MNGAPEVWVSFCVWATRQLKVMKWNCLVCWKRFRPVGMAVRAVYIPPFARARRMGHPSFCVWLRVVGWGTWHPRYRWVFMYGPPAHPSIVTRLILSIAWIVFQKKYLN